MPQEKTVNVEWPNGFRAGQAVLHEGRRGHVVSVPLHVVPHGEVPVMYDDESGGFVTVPADGLHSAD